MTGEPTLTCLCGKCGKTFALTADHEVTEGEERRTFVQIRSCDSGGIYATYVECPWCRHKFDLQ